QKAQMVRRQVTARVQFKLRAITVLVPLCFFVSGLCLFAIPFLWLTKLRNDGRVIGGTLPFSWLYVDPGANASRHEWGADPDVIDPQSQISPKRARSIIPPPQLSTLFTVYTQLVR